jgi:uncharacterized protein YjbJ (UPF0337 family)
MGASDKIKNTSQATRGKVKRKVGEATGDNKLKAKGRADQAKGNLKQAGEKIKDAL